MIKVYRENDCVILENGRISIQIPYRDAFDISQNMCMAARQVMRFFKEMPLEIKIDKIEKARESKDKRKIRLKEFNWKIDIRDYDERVFIKFGNVDVILHFTEALELSEHIRQHAKNAKIFSGDKWKSINAVGILTDAEKDYKLGI